MPSLDSPLTAKADGPTGPAARVGSIPGGIRLGVAAILIVGFLQFWLHTMPVRLANTDDVIFQNWTDQGTVAEHLADNALTQGRFYQATPVFAWALSVPYRIHQPWLFSLFRTIAFFTEAALAGALLARMTRNPALGAALVVLVVGTLHIPITYYLLLSYPFDGVGFCAVLAALHLHFSANGPARIASGVCFLLACLMHEIFLCFLPLFPLISWLRGDRHWIRSQLGPVTVAVTYVAVYVLFARLHPSTYEGTRFLFNLTAIQQVVVRQLIGDVPGFELVVFRFHENAGPLFRSGADVLATIAAVPVRDCVIAIGEAVAAGVLLTHALRARPVPALGWLGALAFAAGLNLPIALSARYHDFILCREYPYAYTFYSFFFLLAGFLGFLSWVTQAPVPRPAARIITALVIAGLFAACLSAAASNHRVLEILRERYN